MVFAPFAPTYTPEPTRCSSTGARSGTIVLQAWACEESPWAPDLWDVGIFACRDVFGGWCPRCNYAHLSAHASGRSGDSGHNIIDNHSHPSGLAYAAWLVANAAVLGIQEVISNRRRWDNQSKAWKTYSGVSPHIDHVHWTLNESGARYLTLDRILSVAPQEDPLMALTDAEAHELLNNSRATKLLATASLDRLADIFVVVRRAGSSGMSTVALQFGSSLLPLSSVAARDQLMAQFGQDRPKALTADVYGALQVLS